MAAPSLTPATLAVNLPRNPVICEGPGCLSPAIHVFEALAPGGDPADPRDQLSQLICGYWGCHQAVGFDADRLGLFEQERRDATVADLELVSGLEIPVAA